MITIQDTVKKFNSKEATEQAIKELVEYHVTEALKAANKNGKINVIPIDQEQWEVVPEVITSRDLVQHEGIMLEIDKQSILTAYPLNLIE